MLAILPHRSRVFHGRAPSEWQETGVDGTGSAELVKGLPYFDKLFDNYTVIVSAKGFQGAAWKPVNISRFTAANWSLFLGSTAASL